MPNHSEPMFNFSEKPPAYLGGVFILVALLVKFVPRAIDQFLGRYGILRPLEMEGTSGLTHTMSLIGHGFLHVDITHLLINTFMTITFGIVTLRAIKMRRGVAASKLAKKMSPKSQFFIVFFAGVIIGGIFQWGWWAMSNIDTAGAIGASGGASALFATGAWAMGGRDNMIKFGLGWAVINAVLVVAEPIFGGIAWPAHIGGYVAGMILAPRFVKPNATGFKIT